MSFSVEDGTASNCSIVDSALDATSPGTCIVTATSAANGTIALAMSVPTSVVFVAAPLIILARPTTINFPQSSSILSPGAKTVLIRLARRLKARDVTITGYAEGDRTLALHRAKVVAAFLATRTRVHATLHTVTNSSSNKVTLILNS